ncbi:sporulation histidine kinase inhibitor Sda [Sutcliffiella deserti]|uniref:sporulation histidine kinase inhibitor Sda n=1 Tax=Sutcliffiella deserti TaxID=2875501 RepID=UPI001CBFF76C
MHQIKSPCSIKCLSNESLRIAYKQAKDLKLDLHFIQLLKEEINKRRTTQHLEHSD